MTGGPPDELDVDRYLARLGLDRGDVGRDEAGLATLCRAHMRAVAFENLDIAFGLGVPHDLGAAIAKIQSSRRGGWCFELNGAFGCLLEALGFDVMLLGAAVLLSGPTTVLDHLALEVSTDGMEPHLVDVGFGDNFVEPLLLNRAGPQDGGSGTFELLPSPLGTTVTEHVGGVPEARYRFKRVAHDFDDFGDIATAMQADPEGHWRRKPLATRLLGDGADRVTLSHDALAVRRGSETTRRPVAHDDWDEELWNWFEMRRPGPWPESPA